MSQVQLRSTDTSNLKDHPTSTETGSSGKGHQPAGSSWNLYRQDACHLLATSHYLTLRSIYYGSNACYLAEMEHATEGQSLAVYKPAAGEYPLWDFPHGTLHRREVATFEINRLLGWRVVPPTVISTGRFGVGSLQLFVEESSGTEIRVRDLRRVALLDSIANNADRKPGHLLLTSDGGLWGIDHGLTFHTHPKLRTVLWHFAGEPITPQELTALRSLSERLRAKEGRKLRRLIAHDEFAALCHRVDSLIRMEAFPNPRQKAIPYRW